MAIVIGTRSFDDEFQLEKLVVHAAKQYELEGYSEDFDGIEITDPEYDELLRNLRTVYPTSEAFAGTSPSKVKHKGLIIKHDPPMTSIDKADGDLDLKIKTYNRWLDDCSKSLEVPLDQLEICQSYKHDGIALRINYVDGKLASAGLRPEDGINGSDVTRHMKYIKGVFQTLPLLLTLSLNGEIECWHEDFQKVNDACDLEGDEPYKNPRNYTAGCMGRDDPEENKDSMLRMAYYSITGFDDSSKYYKTEIERAKWANSDEGLNLKDGDRGLFVHVRMHSFKDLQVLEDNAKKLPYYVDGVVLKVNNLENQEEMGHVGNDAVKPPHATLAWKFAEETADPTVDDVEWNASRTGRIVPTGLSDPPFVLADTSNSRATCNNYGWMKSQGLGPGAKVLVKKGGKIIPNIVKVITPVSDICAPTHCPTCSYKLEIFTSSSGNQDLMCHNKDCGAKHVKSWIFYIAQMGGKGLGLATMNKLLHTGKIKKLADLYRLGVDDFTSSGLSERQAILALATIFIITPEKNNVAMIRKIDQARTKKVSIEAWKFFAALGIPGAGRTAGKALFNHYKDFDKIRQATVHSLIQIQGIGQITAVSIRDWLEQNSTNIDALLQHVDLELPKSGKLSGKNFVLTGAFDLGKKHWETQIQNEGGNCQSGVGKDTNYLLKGKSDGAPSDKEKKAVKYATPIISLADLQAML